MIQPKRVDDDAEEEERHGQAKPVIQINLRVFQPEHVQHPPEVDKRSRTLAQTQPDELESEDFVLEVVNAAEEEDHVSAG